MESTFSQREARFNQGARAKFASIENGELRMQFASGAALTIPVSAVRPLAELTEEQIADVRVTVGGLVLLWPQGGASIKVEALVKSATTPKVVPRSENSVRSEPKVRANSAGGN